MTTTPPFPILPRAIVPAIDAAAMAEVDRLMDEVYRIGVVRMMELAGRHLAHLARVRYLASEPEGPQVVVLAGVGGNGGGALAAARRLAGWGANVQVFLARAPEDIGGIAAEQLAILNAMEVAGTDAQGDSESLVAAASEAAVILDGLIGYSLKAAPRGRAGAFIESIASANAPVLALDLPSGIDATTGEVMVPAVKAAATMTLALPKTGLYEPQARAHVGALYLADIGVPPALYAQPSLGLTIASPFAHADIVEIAL